jgi:hypothetical protein
MQTEELAARRRVLRRWNAQERERLIKEQAHSGLTKKAFCEQQGINLGTFHGGRDRGGVLRVSRTARPSSRLKPPPSTFCLGPAACLRHRSAK